MLLCYQAVDRLVFLVMVVKWVERIPEILRRDGRRVIPCGSGLTHAACQNVRVGSSLASAAMRKVDAVRMRMDAVVDAR